MIERIKSLVLLLLVTSSVFFTSQQWTTGFSPITPGRPGPEQGEPQPLDVLSPWMLYVHKAGGSELFGPGQAGFEQSWQLLRNITRGFHLVSIRSAAPAEWQAMLEHGALEFRLAGRVQLRMWLEALSVLPAELTTAHFFNHILLSPGSNDIYFRDSHTGIYVAWENILAGDPLKDFAAMSATWTGQPIRRLDEPHRSAAAAWVYVPANPGFWHELWVRTERGTLQGTVNSFFSDLSLVRRVGERDGRTIFTDGKRLVHVDAYGGFEFVESSQFLPLHDIHSRAGLLLSQGLSFVARHGGWPTESRVRQMNMVDAAQVPYAEFEFIVFFRVPGGEAEIGPSLVPLVSWRPEVALRVTERNVSTYERFVYAPLRSGSWPYRIIQAEAALRTLDAGGHEDGEITSMYLAYYQREIQTEGLLFPVWVIEKGARRFMVNAYTADFVEGP